MNKNIINEGLAMLMQETFEMWNKCNEKNSKELHKEKAEKILAEYIALNGCGCVSYIQGVDTEKGNIFSMANLMGIKF
jgi:hypothetical protein